MDLPHIEHLDPKAQRRIDVARLRRALTTSLAGVLALVLIFFMLQPLLPVDALSVQPHALQGLVGMLTAPLLHGSPGHLATNAFALLLLGTLAGSVVPRATVRALPLLWVGSGIGAWLLGEPGTHHLGASGVTLGLLLLLMTLGIARHERAVIAASMIGMMFFGGVLAAVLPGEPGISWQSHLGGAVAGVIAGMLFRNADPMPQRRRYSWELEEELEARIDMDDDGLELPRPHDVPVLWQGPSAPSRGVVVPFRRRVDE